MSVSSDNESVPLVPGPPWVWHAADGTVDKSKVLT